MPRVPDNDNLELKKRSRRRLVGAAALALLAAIVLPMVMDDEPASPVREIQVTIPERALDSSPIAALPESGERSEAVPAALDDASPEVEQAVRPVEPAAVARPAEPASPPPAPSAAIAPPAKPAAVPSGERPVPPVASVRDAESDEAARARAILEGRTPATAPMSGSGSEFVVQVGAFSDPGKASARQIELAARGFKSYVETGEGVSRVRVGPFATRADAESMQRRLKEASLDGVVSTR